MKSLFFIILIIFLMPFYVEIACANTEFNIHVVETKEFTKEYNIVVDLGETYFSYTKGNIQHIYDFGKKRIIKLDREKKIFTDDSLFSDIGLRAYKFQTRLGQKKPISGGDSQNNAISSVFYEHLFSLKMDNQESEILETSVEGVVSYSFKDSELLSCSKEGKNVSKNEMDMFIKFFRYVFGGHPNILEKMSKERIIPKFIRIYHYDDSKKIETLSLSCFKTTPNHFFSLATYSSGVLAKDDDGFLHFLHQVKHSKKNDLIQYIDSLLQEADKYFQNGFFLDTMLCFIEYRFVSGLPFPSDFENKKLFLEADDNVLKLFEAIQAPENTKTAQKHLDLLTSLEKEAKFKKHILLLFKANTYLKIGHHQDAKNLFHKALRANSNIALAYKDLGGIYFKESNTKIAWRCWDVARKIAPGHRMLMYLDGYEKRFEMNYPEYF